MLFIDIIKHHAGHVIMYRCMTVYIYLYSRWWPAEIVSDVPDSLLSSKPTQCMFLVRFFATEQYFWTHHGRVIAFTEDCLSGSYKRRSYGSLSKQAQTHAHYMKG